MKKELKRYEISSYFNNIRLIDNIDDSFVQEVVDVWKKNNWEGVLYCFLNEQTSIIAFVLVQTDQNQFWTIRGTWTNPKYRGTGLSTKLLKEVIRDFEFEVPHDHETLLDYLWVNINPGVEELYRSVGFNVLGKRTDCEPNFSVGVYSRHKNKDQELKRFLTKYPKHVLY